MTWSLIFPLVHEDGSPEVRSLGQEEVDLVSVRVHDDAEDVLKAAASGPCGGAICET